LWLALAKVEDYKNAQKVLNKARKCNPLSLAIWISAARLEEAQAQVDSSTHGLGDRVENILSKGRDILRKNGANISREEWLEEAWHAEGSGSPVVCERLVKLSVSLGLAEEEVKNVVQKDVQFYEKERAANLTTRFLFRYGVLATRSQELMREMLEF
jgi:pre-mRNA-processing factor 6